MAQTIPGIEIEALTPKQMFIRRKKSQNLKVKLLAINKNNETIRVQGDKDTEAKEYFLRDVLSLHVKSPKEGMQLLSIEFMSGMEIELFEASKKEFNMLSAFQQELLGYLAEFMPVHCNAVA
nr:hypothetical protein [Candidatus Sigynarchaeota archaeon]